MRRLIRVRLTAQLKDLAGGAREVELDSAEDLGSAVRKLDVSFPGIERRIMDDQGTIRPHVNVFVNSENSRDLQREQTRLKDGDLVQILPAVSGG